jgi:5-deoxy-glucuronate isomerase
VTATTELELAVCAAPGGGNHPVRVIADADMGLEVRGTGSNARRVRNILHDADTGAESLLVVEVITPEGNWSSYPPHKHGANALPEENSLEETYYHRLNPSQGFAFQRVYTDDRSFARSMKP